MAEFSGSIAKHYHERTKYDPETIAQKNKTLDWEKQPVPFKEYKIGQTFDLKPYLTDEELDSQWRRLSKLLFCSYGLTAKMATMFGSPLYLRAAPSAGGLYPVEVYLLSRGTDLLPPGLYNYQPQTHTLVHFWESEIWADLQAACFQHPALEKTKLAIATSAIFYRSAWRYEDRAYRRIFLDTGHILGNIELACAINSYRPYPIGGFNDEAIDKLLYLNSNEEGVMTVIPLLDLQNDTQKVFSATTALPSEVTTDYQVVPDGELLGYFHQKTQIDRVLEPLNKEEKGELFLEDKYNFPFCTKISTKITPIDWQENLSGIENTILKRRSTRAYTGANLTLLELNALLNFTYQPQDYARQGLDGSPDYFDLSLLETFVAVSGVDGLEEGCYYYAPKAQELRQIRFKNFRRELHYLCLGQDLGRDAGAVIFHTADLKLAISKYGDRVYRYLHLDAGHLGQRLNLAAIYLDLGVSGIGGFFDDQVNEVLGIPADEAVIYITTLGRPRRR
ncbi:SagB/ThcOx family dehydrogenase [Oscillatoria salina]|uniref:SagB/ThcOx family dehydrogenase n=1 Tax=Oscillatoria salina TaxID=331517 RepID=UPI0013B6923A|nr:SagB/ThcOx family dehydrogenase [Oscillatoria salina]MBZ8181575.1 SagB/ThcOx family dehydrogenase [Oscillatoria salina IIICB1]NET90372.1 SagB/ThcOx family dehydrogenase [Kamptonema sp. SIO1D9]